MPGWRGIAAVVRRTPRVITFLGAWVLALSLAMPALASTDGPVLRQGDSGVDVRLVQRFLRAGGYYWGPMNGDFDTEMRFALLSLQKHRHLETTGQAGTAEWHALAHPRRGRPLVGGGADRIEVDLRRQLLTVYRDHHEVLISHISTGTGRHYCRHGHCGTAITPVGDFRITGRSPGWHRGPLGAMFDSLYFHGPVAIHGSTTIPLHPASHGCVRLPLETARHLFALAKPGEPIYVRGTAPRRVRGNPH